MTKGKLQEIADGMRRAVLSKPVCWSEYTLGHGLRVILSRSEERWVLSLRRPGVFPSLDEVRICAERFGVPEGTEPSRRQLQDNKPAPPVRWFIVDLAWTEIPASGTATRGQVGSYVAAAG